MINRADMTLNHAAFDEEYYISYQSRIWRLVTLFHK